MHSALRPISLLGAGACLLAFHPVDVGAKSVSDAPAAAAATRVVSEAHAAAPKAAADSELIEFEVDRAIAEVCDIPTSSIYLSIDATSLTQEAKDRLKVVARCVNVEVLADEALVLLGRSDPENPDSYSDTNLERAILVRTFLINEGANAEALAVKARNDVERPIEDRPYDKPRRVTLQRSSDV